MGEKPKVPLDCLFQGCYNPAFEAEIQKCKDKCWKYNQLSPNDRTGRCKGHVRRQCVHRSELLLHHRRTSHRPRTAQIGLGNRQTRYRRQQCLDWRRLDCARGRNRRRQHRHRCGKRGYKIHSRKCRSRRRALPRPAGNYRSGQNPLPDIYGRLHGRRINRIPTNKIHNPTRRQKPRRVGFVWCI